MAVKFEILFLYRNQQDLGSGPGMPSAAAVTTSEDDRSRSGSQDKYDGDVIKTMMTSSRHQDSIEEEEEEEGFEVSDNGEDGSLIIDEPPSTSSLGKN